MKRIVFSIMAVSTFGIAAAQSVTINGSVKDTRGNGVPLAMVQDKKDNAAARTDSVGKFSLQVDPNSTLLVSSAGYEPKSIKVNGRTDILVVLDNKKTGSTTEELAAQERGTPGNAAFNDYTGYNGTGNSLLYGGGTGNGLLPQFHPVDATQGSRYLANEWLDGYVIAADNSVIKNPKFGLNYDKIGGGLLLSQDRNTAIEVDKDKVKSFTIVDKLGQENTFVSVPDIDKSHYVVILSDGAKYKFYKQIKTKFIKANYTTDGMTSRGNNYDEYADEYTYFVLNAQTGKLEEIAPKKKAIKAYFEPKGIKLDNFFEEVSGKIDDGAFKNLGTYVNK